MRMLAYFFVILFLSGCTERVPGQPERLAEDELPAYREASAKMSKYIELEDSAFHLTISKEKALENGVSEKYYLRIQQELDFTNYTIKECNKKGMPIDIDDYWQTRD